MFVLFQMELLTADGCLQLASLHERIGACAAALAKQCWQGG
jgi:hypothetical protein